jgi:hypothetical protein
MASHLSLQYLPDVGTHERSGCGHVSLFEVSVSLFQFPDKQLAIQARSGSTGTVAKKFASVKRLQDRRVRRAL